jgi:hypothetical protein
MSGQVADLEEELELDAAMLLLDFCKFGISFLPQIGPRTGQKIRFRRFGFCPGA